MEIDYDAPLPPHRQIAAWIRDKIDSGELRPGQRIPSETDIMGEFGVARTTSRRAVAYLRNQGLIVTVQARGSYVSTP
jgi:GntR family transcriptional regulator